MFAEEVIDILKENGLYVKKSLGQNFLLCDDVLDRIVEEGNLSKGDTVLEIGPGLGFLTERLLAAGANLTAMELSDNIIPYLEKKFTSDSFRLLHQDVLHANIPEVFAGIPSKDVGNDPGRAVGEYSIIANIPYYLTGKLIPYFLENTCKPKEMILMLQKEVAERLVVKDGKQSKLSISTNFFADVEYLFDVPKDCFHPVPKVDSAMIKIVTKNTVPDIDQKLFFRVMRGAFSNKRKQMHNSLSGVFLIEKEEAFAWLKRAEIKPDIRAEKLALEDFVRLARTFEG